MKENPTIYSKYIQLLNEIDDISEKYRKLMDDELSVVYQKLNELQKNCPHENIGVSPYHRYCSDCGKDL